MACAAHEIRHGSVSVGSGPHRALVIADRGDPAFVVAVDFATPPVVGDRFAYQGLTWEVTRPKTMQRGLVACPLRRR